MRIENDGPVGPRITRNDDTPLSATTAAAARAARDAAGNPAVTPQQRAELGWAIANKPPQSGAGLQAQAIGDASANARTALARTDLAPQQRAAVERLGTALADGRIDPHVNDAFRQDLYKLATEPADSSNFRGAAAQLTRAAEVLDQAKLAPGTRLAYDPKASPGQVGSTGLPILNVDNIDADLYFKTADGTLHIEGAKATPQTLSNEIQKAEAREGGPKPSQLGRQSQWAAGGTEAEPRSLGLYVLDDGPGFDKLLDDKRLAQLDKLAGSDPDARRFVVGDRTYSINDFKRIASDADAAAKAHVQSLGPLSGDETAAAYKQFYKDTLGTASQAAKSYGAEYGAPRPTLQRLPPPELPSLKQGGLIGGAVAGGLTLLRVAADGQITRDEAVDLAKQTAVGAGAGVATAAGERVVTPLVDRAVGSTVQRVATQAATSVSSTATAESAAAFGAGARTVISRVGGSTIVGAVVATGISAYENRDGLAKGDSRAIGNVAADATVAAGSIAAATATGAAIGSVVPVAGTAVGAVVGLAVGVGIAYGAQISGARDWIAGKAAGLVDGIKSWF